MTVDGVAAVQQRIAELSSRFASLSPQLALATAPGAPPAASSTTTSSASLGAAAFADALGRQAGAIDLTGALGGAGQADAGGLEPAAAGGLTPATVRRPGAYGALQPPAALAAYGNGRIPASALAPIGIGQHRLWGPAADAFVRMRADAAAQGVQIGVTDSYRSYDEQVALAGRKGLYGQGGLAATPGTSNHGWGMALDVDVDARGQAWLRANGARYGFVEAVPREPWHWEYRPDPAPSGAAAAPPT